MDEQFEWEDEDEVVIPHVQKRDVTEPVIDDNKGSHYGYDGENGKFIHHREDGPAFIGLHCVTAKWVSNGILHREDGPAVMTHQVSNEWFLNGICHCVNGPAFTSFCEDLTRWYFNGVLHRKDGPAVVMTDYVHGELIRAEWWQYGVRHRENGPAVISDYHYEWWFNGKNVHSEQGLESAKIEKPEIIPVEKPRFSLIKRMKKFFRLIP